ncbi:FtsX-like permease family protein [Bifidobacterium scardovii]|uniref:FtsX-like permease family protein n=1 Tax=Bifidobacterium scardovii TaxID=158787 RepID=UPI003F6AE7C0
MARHGRTGPNEAPVHGLDAFAEYDTAAIGMAPGRGGDAGTDRPAAAKAKGSGMSGAFVKDTLRCWLRGWKRFASIAVISLLGVAVLTGIYAGCRDMFLAANRFYDAQGLHDIQVMSTYGLTEDDVDALRQVKGVKTVQAERSQSVETTVDGTDKTVTISEIGTNGLDQPYLQSGRMPSKAGEVAVTKKFLMDSGLAIGDTLTVTPVETSQGTADAASSSAQSGDASTEESSPGFPTELTITGEVLDPKDLSNPDGIGTAAFRMSLASDYTFFAPSDGVTGTIYTAISLTVEGAGGKDSFSSDYDDTVREVADRITNTVQNKRQQERRQTLVDEAQSTLDKAKADAAKQLDEAQRQIDDKRTELDNGKTQLKESKQTLEDSQVTLENNADRLQEGRDQLNAGLTQARNGQSQLQQGLATAQTMSEVAGQAAFAAEQAADAAEQAVRNAEQGLTVPSIPPNGGTGDEGDNGATPSDGTESEGGGNGSAAGTAHDSALDALRQAAQKARDTANQLRAKANESSSQVAQLQEQLAAVNATIAQLEQQSEQLSAQAEQIRQGRQQIREGFKQIEASEEELADGETQLKDAQAQLDAKRESADKEFAKQQQRVDDIAAARWYVQTRSAIGGFSSLKSDVSSIESIGRAFPVVFLIVAVLMSLTTMTRMVEEERGLIGTYTGLGYSHTAIALRYVLFAMLACLVGGGLGLLVGFLGIPAFLLIVLEGLYSIPDIHLEYDWFTGTGGIALFVVGIVAATLIACVGEMRQTPAELMRPKAPKAGTRVLLERIPPIWRRLSFLNKVTVRNIARFKSRLIMTVGGVAGCTALIVCGLAINDTVDTIGPKQYEGIIHYDMLVVGGDDDADAMRKRIESDGRTEQVLDLRIESGELDAGDSGETIQLMVIPDESLGALNDMVTLKNVAGDHATQVLNNDGVIVTQSAANALGVSGGDGVMLRDGEMRPGEVKVSAVIRNLIGSDVYISESLYKKAFGVSSPLTWNAMLATLDGTADDNIAYVDKLSRDPSVLSAASTDDLERGFTFKLMSAVVALIVGLAGGLALAVLFTLANTNVSERVREMATLKVLGFYDREVHTYVNKEMLILTGAGIAVGLPLGRAVGGLLTRALSMPSIYFEVQVHWYSYVIAAAATLVFALLVQLFTNPVLDRIDPVSSLKSVE